MLINRIIEEISGIKKANPVRYPALPLVILTKETNSEERKEHWNYRSVIGMLNFLKKSTHSELCYVVYQCARFCNDPKMVYEQAVKRLIQYLLSTVRKDDPEAYEGLVFKIDKTKNIEVYVDAAFAGDWNQSWSQEPSSVFSRTGYFITYAGCPITWLSKPQTEISLSSTESEYIALSHSMREAIPMITLLQELKEILPIEDTTPKIHCTIFEDNNSCIEMVKCPKMRPRSKHIGLKYHHFRSKVKEELVTIKYVNTENQLADLLTKALSEAQFLKLRRGINGW